MGHPKKTRKKYKTPSHPRQKDRIEEEKVLIKEYGLKNKKEVWKTDSNLRKIKRQAKKLIASTTEQSKKEKQQLLSRLFKYGLAQKTSKAEDLLELTTKDFLERRLQTVVYRKGLAKTMKQARQFIVHEHVRVNNRKISSPCHLVTQAEEATIEFCNKSNLANIEHPERTIEKKEAPVKEEKKEKKEKREKKGKKKKEKPKVEKKEEPKEEVKEKPKVEKKEESAEKTEEVKEE